MKKLIVVGLMLVMCCGVALADHAANIVAWKNLTPGKRYAKESKSLNIRDAAYKGSPAQVEEILNQAKLDMLSINTKYHRMAKCIIWEASGNKVVQLLKAGKKADAYTLEADLLKNYPHSKNLLSQTYLLWHPAMLAGLLTQNECDEILDRNFKVAPEKEQLTWFSLLLKHASNGLRSETLIRIINKEPKNIEKIQPHILTLAVAMNDKVITRTEYADLLEKILVASVPRLADMEQDDPERAKVLRALSAVKTIYKELQELE